MSFARYLWVREQIGVIPDAPGGGEPQDIVDDPCTKRPCNYLILGSDSRANLPIDEQIQFGDDEFIGGVIRSDTIIVVHTDPRTKKATVLHFPRDLWVEIPGKGKGRINSAFEGGVEGGGPALVARTIKSLTGLQINHVLYLDLGGFEGVVDALGGVPMCVPRPMYDKDAGLDIAKPGCYVFDGSTALAYVRARHLPGDCIPDFARIGRQQQFLRALLAKVLSPSQLLSLPGLISEIVGHIRVDKGLQDPSELVHLADQLNGVNTGDADFRVVPTYPAEVYPNGVFTSVVKLVQPDARELFDRLREGEALGQLGVEQVNTPPSPANIRVAVYDDASSGAARKVFSVLERSGFDTSPGVRTVGATTALPADPPVIAYRTGAADMADVVAGFIPNLEVHEVPAASIPGADVAVLVDAGFVPERPGGDGGVAPPSC